MKRMLTVIALMTAVVAAQAAEDGINITNVEPVPGQNSPADYTLIEAWNDNGATGSTSTYVSPCFGFLYVPSVDYVLEKIEWYAGDISGQVATTIRDGGLNGPDLSTTGPYMENPPRDWQGVDLQTPIPVVAGQTYGIVYEIVVGAQVSGASTGTIIPHYHDPSGACTSFNGPYSSLPWRARFYGTMATPVDATTWGRIKNVYND